MSKSNPALLALFFLALILFLVQPLMGQKKMFVFIGQSNMAGRASIEQRDFPSLPNTFLFNDEGDFVKARNPLNAYSNIRKDIALQRKGLAGSFAKGIHKAFEKDSILLVVNARGGTAIERFMKGDSTEYYKLTLDRIKSALKKEPTAELEAIIWHQGESNRKNYTNYLQKLKKLISDYRKDLALPQLPIICGQLGLWNPEYELIRKEIAKIETSIPNAYLVSSEDLNNFDEHHFDSQAQEVLGLRYAQKYLKLNKH